MRRSVWKLSNKEHDRGRKCGEQESPPDDGPNMNNPEKCQEASRHWLTECSCCVSILNDHITWLQFRTLAVYCCGTLTSADSGLPWARWWMRAGPPKETLENSAILLGNGPAIAGVDWLHGHQAVWFWLLRAVYGQEVHPARLCR